MNLTMRDAKGNTVQHIVLDGVAQFLVRDRWGYVPEPMGVKVPPITTPEGLEAVGVDLSTLMGLVL